MLSLSEIDLVVICAHSVPFDHGYDLLAWVCRADAYAGSHPSVIWYCKQHASDFRHKMEGKR